MLEKEWITPIYAVSAPVRWDAGKYSKQPVTAAIGQPFVMPSKQCNGRDLRLSYPLAREWLAQETGLVIILSTTCFFPPRRDISHRGTGY